MKEAFSSGLSGLEEQDVLSVCSTVHVHRHLSLDTHTLQTLGSPFHDLKSRQPLIGKRPRPLPAPVLWGRAPFHSLSKKWGGSPSLSSAFSGQGQSQSQGRSARLLEQSPAKKEGYLSICTRTPVARAEVCSFNPRHRHEKGSEIAGSVKA